MTQQKTIKELNEISKVKNKRIIFDKKTKIHKGFLEY